MRLGQIDFYGYSTPIEGLPLYIDPSTGEVKVPTTRNAAPRAFRLPTGTTADRPPASASTSPPAGMRANYERLAIEYYDTSGNFLEVPLSPKDHTVRIRESYVAPSTGGWAAIPIENIGTPSPWFLQLTTGTAHFRSYFDCRLLIMMNAVVQTDTPFAPGGYIDTDIQIWNGSSFVSWPIGGTIEMFNRWQPADTSTSYLTIRCARMGHILAGQEFRIAWRTDTPRNVRAAAFSLGPQYIYIFALAGEPIS